MIQAVLGSPWYGHIANTASAQVFFYCTLYVDIKALTLSANYDDIYKSWSFNFCSEFAVVHLIRIFDYFVRTSFLWCMLFFLTILVWDVTELVCSIEYKDARTLNF